MSIIRSLFSLFSNNNSQTDELIYEKKPTIPWEMIAPDSLDEWNSGKKLREFTFGKNGGLHGTNLERLGSQIQEGQFENKGKKIYFANQTTAEFYARNTRICEKEGTPIVVQIASDQHPKLNDYRNSDLGAYEYFEPKSKVEILRAWKLKKPDNWPK